MANKEATESLLPCKELEKWMINEGLVHIPKLIFGHLQLSDILLSRKVCRSWRTFVDKAWRSDWVLKLDTFLERKLFYLVPRNLNIEDKTYLEENPDWKDLCDYLKKDASYPMLRYMTNSLITLYKTSRGSGLSHPPLSEIFDHKEVNEVKFIKFLLYNPIQTKEFQKPFTNTETLLHAACKYRWDRQYELIELLLNTLDRSGIDVNAKNREGKTALFVASMPNYNRGDNKDREGKASLRLMLSRAKEVGIDVNFKYKGQVGHYRGGPFDTCQRKAFKDGISSFQLFCNQSLTLDSGDLDMWMDHDVKLNFKTLQMIPKTSLCRIIVELFEEKRSKGMTVKALLRDLKNPTLSKNGRLASKSIEKLTTAHIAEVLVNLYEERKEESEVKEPYVKKRKLL